MLAVFAISIGVQAQETRKEGKAVEKMEKQAKSAEEITQLMVSSDFKFIPSEVSSRTGIPIVIFSYEYMRVLPGGELQIRMTKPQGALGMNSNMFIVETTMAQIVESAPKDGFWVMVIKVDTDAIITMTITTEMNTGLATVLVESNKQETFIYKGKIVAN